MKLDVNSSSIVAILIQQSDSVLALLEFSLHRKNNFICQLNIRGGVQIGVQLYGPWSLGVQ